MKRRKIKQDEEPVVYRYDTAITDVKKRRKKATIPYVGNLLEMSNMRQNDCGAGWNALEAAQFQLVMSKYGAGNWDVAQYYLPHHNTAQFNNLGQKLFGQQSLAAVSGLKICPYMIWKENATKRTLRKNGTVVHTGASLQTDEKKAIKIENASKQHVMRWDIPVVEDRGHNYSKLMVQSARMCAEIDDELTRRGLDTHCVHKYKKREACHERWLNPPTEWPQAAPWDLKAEYMCPKKQDNVWAKCRMVESNAWLQCDQAGLWSYLNGSCFNHKNYPDLKQKKKRDNKIDNIDKKRLVNRFKIAGRKTGNCKEHWLKLRGEQKKKRRKEIKKAASKRYQQKKVNDWTSLDLCSFLKANGWTSAEVAKVRLEGITGKNCFNLPLDAAERALGSLQTKYDQLLMRAMRTYGYTFSGSS